MTICINDGLKNLLVEPVIVGKTIQTLGDGRRLVTGVVAIMEEGQPFAFNSLDALATFLVIAGFEPMPLPAEEGWDEEQITDLFEHEREELLRCMYAELEERRAKVLEEPRFAVAL